MSFQAAPERDHELRSKALILAEDLRDAVSGVLNNKGPLHQLAQVGHVRFETTLLPGAVPGLEENVDIVVLLEPVDEAHPQLVGGATPTPPTLALFILPPVDYPRLVAAVLNPRNPRHREAQRALGVIQQGMDAWFARHTSAVVHELIHLFDFIRAEVGQLQPQKRRTREEYVSNPWEYNAHFQHMIVELGQELQRAPGWVQRVAFESFEAFVEFAAKTRAGAGFLPHLDMKYRKKALSRLWQTWDHMREQSRQAEAARLEREHG